MVFNSKGPSNEPLPAGWAENVTSSSDSAYDSCRYRARERGLPTRLDDQWPVSWLTDRSTLVTRTANGPEPAAADWVIGGRDVPDPANWHRSLAERDT